MSEIQSMSARELEALKIIYPGTKNIEQLEVFRNLRTRLLQRESEDNFVVLVSSAVRGAGASFVATNLAAAFALDHSKTAVLVDCHVMNPRLNEVLRLPPDYGLTDYLRRKDVGIDDIIYASGIPRLRLVPAGTPSEVASELFSSKRMSALINGLKERYPDRYIILDAPSVTSGSEVRVLSQLSDQAILVVPHGKVTPSQIMGSIDVLGRDKFVGTIFNN